MLQGSGPWFSWAFQPPLAPTHPLHSLYVFLCRVCPDFPRSGKLWALNQGLLKEGFSRCGSRPEPPYPIQRSWAWPGKSRSDSLKAQGQGRRAVGPPGQHRTQLQRLSLEPTLETPGHFFLFHTEDFSSGTQFN